MGFLDKFDDRRQAWIGIFFALAGLLVSGSSAFISVFDLYGRRTETRIEQDLPSKIQKLTASLNSAAEVIGQIELEIKQRQELVQQLEKDADKASKLAALNKDQLDAVAQVLRTEIKSDERQNFWTAQILAFFYAALGVALSELYRFIMRWRARKRIVGS